MKVYALVGPSGTGKSHRASMVAIEKNAEAIIDDGLLITDGRIVAGYSAKREATMVAAVKRAILADPEHARLIKEAIARLHLSSILILGTSTHMIQRIMHALDMDEVPVHWILIESVASLEERTLAQRVRREQGKHVIPAPTMEVRKSFSGYLIDPLRFMFRRKGRAVMVEKSIVRPTYSGLGRFYISDTVITNLTTHVARHCSGLVQVHRVMVQSASAGLSISLEVSVATAGNLFTVLKEVQVQVKQQIEMMTALNVLVLNVVAKHWVHKNWAAQLSLEPAADGSTIPASQGSLRPMGRAGALQGKGQ